MCKFLDSILNWIVTYESQLLNCALIALISSVGFTIVFFCTSEAIKRKGMTYISRSNGNISPSSDPFSVYYFNNPITRKSSRSSSFDLNLDVLLSCFFILVAAFSLTNVGTYIYFIIQAEDYPHISFESFIENSPSLALSAILGTLALISICTAINRTFCAAVSTQELFTEIRLGRRAMISIMIYGAGILFHLAESAFERFGSDSESLVYYRAIFSLCGFFCFLISGTTAVYLAATLLKALLNEDEKLMDQLHHRVYQRIRPHNSSLNSNNKASINACLEYLFEKILDADKQQISQKFINTPLHLISFLDKYDEVVDTLKPYVQIRTLCIQFLLTGVLTFGICVGLRYHFIIWFLSFSASFIINALFIKMTYKCCPVLRKLYIHLTLGVWGFTWVDSNNIAIFNMQENNYLKNKHWGASEQQYLCRMYDTVSFFRDALSADEEVAQYVLERIRGNVAANKRGYMLYAVCLHLFKSKYPNQKYTQSAINDFRNSIKDVKFNDVIFAKNVSEIAWDVLRTDEKPKCAYMFRYKAKKKTVRKS